MPNPKNFNKDIKKLDGNNLNKVTGGKNDITDESSFFKKNRISTTCDKCGKKQNLKIYKNEMGEVKGSCCTIMYQYATVSWTCKNCGQKNITELKRFDNGFIFHDFSPWYGLNDFIE